jgi:hypothetical protein
MAGKVQFINFGGTLIMEPTPHGYVPAHDIDELLKLCGQPLDYLPRSRRLRSGKIDSIEFDIKSHYRELREEVLNIIRMDDVPIIAGGTDTLRFYGALLAEDLARLHKEGKIKNLPPVILASSMRAYGDNPQHVCNIVTAAQIAANNAVAEGRSGVFALLPDGEKAENFTLLDMRRPADKISGELAKAFVGTEHAVDMHVKDATEAFKKFSVQGNVAPYLDPYRHRRVAPPLERSNSPEGIAQFLREVGKHPEENHFGAVIIKGLLEKASNEQTMAVAHEVASLAQRGVDVIFVNDPEYSHVSNELEFDKNFQNPLRQKLLTSAGAILLDGKTSVQAYIEALNPKGLEGQEARKHKAASFLKEHKTGTHRIGSSRPVKALAIEYVPSSGAYAAAVKLAAAMGIKTLVTSNLTDGALASYHRNTFEDIAHQYPEMTTVFTYKYAGRKYGQGSGRFTERVTSSNYAVARETGALVTMGGDESPEQIMQKALGRNHGR